MSFYYYFLRLEDFIHIFSLDWQFKSIAPWHIPMQTLYKNITCQFWRKGIPDDIPHLQYHTTNTINLMFICFNNIDTSLQLNKPKVNYDYNVSLLSSTFINFTNYNTEFINKYLWCRLWIYLHLCDILRTTLFMRWCWMLV